MSQSEIDRLYRTYGFIIYGRCIRLLGCRDEARDATQVVFMKLLRAYETIQDKERVVPWIFRTAQNHCFNLLRDRKKFVYGVEPDELVDQRNDGDGFTKKDLIEQVMKRFNRAVREAVYYSYVEEFDQREIQKLTGQSPATIRRNLKRFREALPVALKRLGMDGV
ncbi:MAG: sigma-70 family RNA polymerase sigma factor [Chitinispirillaceae bacterium]|nr:sigma-70 family RNA polymerase sigma factor [Chitinispirillaceae bacterium]